MTVAILVAVVLMMAWIVPLAIIAVVIAWIVGLARVSYDQDADDDSAPPRA
jgi:hypothetical protein